MSTVETQPYNRLEEAAPIYHGAYVALGSVAYGLYLRKLGKQLGVTEKKVCPPRSNGRWFPPEIR